MAAFKALQFQKDAKLIRIRQQVINVCNVVYEEYLYSYGCLDSLELFYKFKIHLLPGFVNFVVNFFLFIYLLISHSFVHALLLSFRKIAVVFLELCFMNASM